MVIFGRVNQLLITIEYVTLQKYKSYLRTSVNNIAEMQKKNESVSKKIP